MKIAAIWARVSTSSQAETSLDSQVARAKDKLEGAGYVVPPERILQIDWTSLDLFNCPEFKQLRYWIHTKQINALGIYDRDRLTAQGLQRLLFLSECKEANIDLVICYGPPILGEPEGQLIELALAIGKERSVLRAQQGAKDGLHDRATKRGLPIAHHRVFGYKWSDERDLKPDHNWDTVNLIFNMALRGSTCVSIVKELRSRGILSPSGLAIWNANTISSLLHNPIYAGRYYALKKLAAKPTTRRGVTYGNSSSRILPLEQAFHVPQIIIEAPVVAWEQREQILDQLKKRQKNSKRNAKHDYLLRGFIHCDTHHGKRGEPRRYMGQWYNGSWRYVCPIGRCSMPMLDGPITEEWVKDEIKDIIGMDKGTFEKITQREDRQTTVGSLKSELRKLEKEYQKTISLDAGLENRYLQGHVDLLVCNAVRQTFQQKRQWIEGRRQSISDQLKQLECQDTAKASIYQIASDYIHRLDDLTTSEWRQLFSSLSLEIHIKECDDHRQGDVKDWYMYKEVEEIVETDHSAVLVYEDVPIEFCIGLPINTQEVENIALAQPRVGG